MTSGAPVAASLLAAALFAASGFALVDLVPLLRARAVLIRLGWAWLFGCAWAGGSAYAGSHVLALTLRRGTLLPLVLLPVFAALVRRLRAPALARSASGQSAAEPRTTFEAILIAALLVLGALVTSSLVAHGLAVPVGDWDGKMTWTAQARYLRGARSVDAPALRDPAAWVTHPRYPVLLPLVQVAAQEIVDAPWEDDRFVRPLYAFFWPAFLLVLFDTASARAGRLAALLVSLAAASAHVPAFSSHGGAAGAYSDLPLACFWGGGLLLLTLAEGSIAEGLAAGALLGAAVLTKNEGLPLAGIALAAAAAGDFAAGRLRARRAPLLAAAGVIAVAALLLVSWRSGIPARYDDGQVVAFSLPALVKGAVSRLPEAGREAVRLMSDRGEWGFTWLAVSLGLLLGARRLRRAGPLALVPGVALLGALAVFAAAYAASPWPIGTLVRSTWDRLLVQMALPLFVLLALALALDARPQPGVQKKARAG